MKRFLIFALALGISIVSATAQTMEQKKICALKWTLQQTFYNKPEGQKLAHLDVCEFKSLEEFQKEKLVADLMKKLSDNTDKSRVANILSAKDENDLLAYIPTNGKAEYKKDVEKMKTQAPAETEETEETENAEESDTTSTSAAVPAPENLDEEPEDIAPTEEVAETEGATGTTSGVSFWIAVLIAFVVYCILSLCIYLFIKSNKKPEGEEPFVSLEQYRTERLRLMERIKALEIALENMKSSAPAVVPQTPKQPETVAPEPQPAAPEVTAPTQSSLFDTEKEEKAEEPVLEIPYPEPAPQPRRKTSIIFFPVPVDGVFSGGTDEIETGKSLYMLKTTDGETGTFTILNTPEAIGTALISLSEMVKPVCKIINTVVNPLEIVTEGPGKAVREGDNWRVISKSTVRLI